MLMTAAVPRALLMLAGGALTDHFSPRRVLMATASERTLLVAAIAVLAWLNAIHLWHIYALSLLFGVADAFPFSAASALMPTPVAPEQLPAANSVFASTARLSGMLGPAPAGIAVKAWGIAQAFFLDAVSFLFCDRGPVACGRASQAASSCGNGGEAAQYAALDQRGLALCLEELCAALTRHADCRTQFLHDGTGFRRSGHDGQISRRVGSGFWHAAFLLQRRRAGRDGAGWDCETPSAARIAAGRNQFPYGSRIADGGPELPLGPDCRDAGAHGDWRRIRQRAHYVVDARPRGAAGLACSRWAWPPR